MARHRVRQTPRILPHRRPIRRRRNSRCSPRRRPSGASALPHRGTTATTRHRRTRAGPSGWPSTRVSLESESASAHHTLENRRFHALCPASVHYNLHFDTLRGRKFPRVDHAPPSTPGGGTYQLTCCISESCAVQREPRLLALSPRW